MIVAIKAPKNPEIGDGGNLSLGLFRRSLNDYDNPAWAALVMKSLVLSYPYRKMEMSFAKELSYQVKEGTFTFEELGLTEKTFKQRTADPNEGLLKNMSRRLGLFFMELADSQSCPFEFIYWNLDGTKEFWNVVEAAELSPEEFESFRPAFSQSHW